MKMQIKEKFKNLNKTQKAVFLAIAVVLFVDIVLGIVVLANKNHSSTYLEAVGFEGKSSLVALNKGARTSLIKNNDFACFKFTAEQKNLFSEVYNQESNVALLLRLKIYKDDKQLNEILKSDSFRFGFLYSDDFESKNRIKKYILDYSKKIEISANESDFDGIVDISFALPKNENIISSIPEGFYIYSATHCKILSACVVPAVVGFDISDEIPFYGFAYNGGKIDFTNSHFDFSGASLVFPVQNTTKYVLPEFIVKFNDDENYKSTLNESYYVDLKFGGEKFSIKNVNKANQIHIPCGAVSNPFQNMEITKNKDLLTSVLLKAVHKVDSDKILTPIKTDPGLILNYNLKDWRTYDYELFEWDRMPGILFFDFRYYETQDRFFTRLAYFVEKEGYKGRLASNEELEGKHGYNAHDYKAVDLANFFNKATDTHFVLNNEELLLKEILIKNNILALEGDKTHVKAIGGGLASVSREIKEYNRNNLFSHEGFHTLFFEDEEFRNYVAAVYYTCDQKSLEFLIDYFKSQPGLGYDVNDEYLMHNEFMSYLLQNTMSNMSDYFVHLANRGSVIAFTPELCAYIRSNKASGFEDAAVALNEFIFDKYGIVSGNIGLVKRVSQNP